MQRTKPRALDEIEAAFPPPPTLSAAARPEWVALLRTLAELGTARVCDLRAVQLLAEVLATEGQLRELIAAEGTTIIGTDGGRKAHPAVRLLESSRNQAHRLLADLGMTPHGRVTVRPAPQKRTEPDPLDEFVMAGGPPTEPPRGPRSRARR